MCSVSYLLNLLTKPLTMYFSTITHFRFKYDLDSNTMHSKFDLTGVQAHDLPDHEFTSTCPGAAVLTTRRLGTKIVSHSVLFLLLHYDPVHPRPSTILFVCSCTHFLHVYYISLPRVFLHLFILLIIHLAF